MKKNIGALMLAASTFALASNVAAAELNFKPYVGLDYAHTRMSSHSPYYHSPKVNIGTMFNKYVGTEVFFQQAAVDYKGSHGKANSYIQGGGLDIMGYLPIGFGCQEKLSLIGSVGFGEYRITYKSGGTKGRDTGHGYRVGAGAMFDVTENIGIRAMYNRIQADKLAGLDHMNEYTVGVRYSF